MVEFEYTGKNLSNKTVKGKIQASSKSEVYDILKQQNIFIYKVEKMATRQFHRGVRLKAKELSEFSRQVGSMLSAGIPITKVVMIIKENASSEKVKAMYGRMSDTISKGNTLSYAMEESNGSFPMLMINMFKSGEMSGGLDHAAIKMAEYYEKEHRLNTKIKGAMTYPAILATMTLFVVIILFTFVLPKFFAAFENVKLPLLTRIVLAISHALTNYWYIILAVAAILIFLIISLLKKPKVKLRVHKIMLKIPKIGSLLRIIYTTRFARTLSSLYSSGVNIIDSVTIASKVIGNTYILSQFENVTEKIRDGNSLSASIENVKGIEKKLIAAIYIGEETGKLDDMLIAMADGYDYDADAATTKLLTFIEPIMIAIMGLIVGSVMGAVMLPMFSMYSSIG